ncbi:MAG: MXAN_5187 C-terminal domain-containing protein, partial [Vicinamibacteria bacterium]
REEGKAFGVHGLKADVLPPPAPEREHRMPTGGGGTGREFRIGNAEADDDKVRALYDRYVEERQRLGEGAAPAYESFRQLIGQQTAKILGDKGARAVDFRLDSTGGKVSLKARIVK